MAASPLCSPPHLVLALHPSPALGWAAVEGCANLTEAVDDWVWEKAGGLRGLDSSLPSSGKGTSQSIESGTQWRQALVLAQCLGLFKPQDPHLLLESTLVSPTCLCQSQVAPQSSASWSWLPGLCLWLEVWEQKFLGLLLVPGASWGLGMAF